MAAAEVVLPTFGGVAQHLVGLLNFHKLVLALGVLRKCGCPCENVVVHERHFCDTIEVQSFAGFAAFACLNGMEQAQRLLPARAQDCPDLQRAAWIQAH
eukprot:353120-Chlamydomonas_euryale.AAC.10